MADSKKARNLTHAERASLLQASTDFGSPLPVKESSKEASQNF